MLEKSDEQDCFKKVYSTVDSKKGDDKERKKEKFYDGEFIGTFRNIRAQAYVYSIVNVR